MDVTTNVTTDAIWQSLANGFSFNVWLAILILLVILVLIVVAKYNKLINLRNQVKNAFADIDTQMQRRFDLVENLVNTVKGYAIHEKETLTNVIQARSSFLQAKTDWEKFAANEQLSGTLRTLYAVAEQYPDLKANQNFMSLQNELTDIENRIAATRRTYNSCVKDYNTSREIFPNNIIANMFWSKFKEAESFSVYNEEAKKAPKVQF